MNVTDRRTMLALQGDLVLVIIEKTEFIFTIVHLVDGDRRELLLVNRQNKERQTFPLTQAVLDNMTPVKHKEAKWKLVL